MRVKTADDTGDGSSDDAEDELADAARLEQTRVVLREVTGDAVSIPVKPVSSATTSFGIRMAEAGRVEIRGAHLAIVAFPRSQPYADSITLQFRRLSLQKKGNYVKIVCVVQCLATVPRNIPLSSSRVYGSSYKLSLFIRTIHEKLFRQLCSRLIPSKAISLVCDTRARYTCTRYYSFLQLLASFDRRNAKSSP